MLVIVSIGIFAYAVTTFTRYVVEGVFRNSFKDTQVKRKISRLSDHVIICGYGRNGKQAAIELLEHKVPIVVIEQDADIVQSLREAPGMLYVEGDADNLFVVLTAKEINSSIKIISRASQENSDTKLKRAGATNVIMPDKIGGQRMAKLVAQPDIVEFIDTLPETTLSSTDQLFALGTKAQISLLRKTISTDGSS